MRTAIKELDEMRRKGRLFLSEHESKAILSLYGIPIAQEMLVATPSELGAVLEDLPFGFPIVMKLDSPDIQHKTEAGLVKLGVQTRDEAANAYIELKEKAQIYHPDARINGVLLQEMATGVVTECIIGVKQDEQFGPVVMFGLGGVMVELFEDVALRLPPFDEDQADEMIREVKAYKLLEGFRGAPHGDVRALNKVLVNMSRLAMDVGERISEIDINPLCVLPNGSGVKAVDALVRLRG